MIRLFSKETVPLCIPVRTVKSSSCSASSSALEREFYKFIHSSRYWWRSYILPDDYISKEWLLGPCERVPPELWEIYVHVTEQGLPAHSHRSHYYDIGFWEKKRLYCKVDMQGDRKQGLNSVSHLIEDLEVEFKRFWEDWLDCGSAGCAGFNWRAVAPGLFG